MKITFIQPGKFWICNHFALTFWLTNWINFTLTHNVIQIVLMQLIEVTGIVGAASKHLHAISQNENIITNSVTAVFKCKYYIYRSICRPGTDDRIVLNL